MRGVVTEIQRFSIHDGPGIRTTVFLKGCNLRCFWCHNPETQNPKPELELFLDRCIGCGECIHVCPHGAHAIEDGERVFHRDLCQACGLCVDTCYTDALVLAGQTMASEDVVREVLRDKAFYMNSGGGLTISGGEPLLQPQFTYEILDCCRAEGIQTAIETAAAFKWDRIAAVLPVTDIVMMDVKVMDSNLHRDFTGVPNEKILANAERLGHGACPLIVRTPVVPGYNDAPEQIAQIAEFLSGLPSLMYYELLAFHPMGAAKYDSLEIDYRARTIPRPSKAHMDALADIAKSYDIEVRHS